MPKKIEKRVTIIFASFIVCVSYLCIGPSELLHFPDSLALMGVGYALAGATLALMYCPALPEMVECSLEYFPGQEREVNNMAAGVFSSCLGIGQVMGPIYGALLEQSVGFRHTTTVTAALNLTYGLAYFAFGGGVAAFTKTYRNFKENE